MKKIVLATLNKDKLNEIKAIWKDIKDVEIEWMGSYSELNEIDETGTTLYENSSIKSAYVSGTLGVTAIADDTGLFVQYLDGAPGVYSARFAGTEATYDENVEKLLFELKGVPREKRAAEFKCVVCLSSEGKDFVFTEGVIKGHITESRVGENGFGYDPIFEVMGSGKTFAQMSLAEKNSVSHRYKAFYNMGELISRGVAQFG